MLGFKTTHIQVNLRTSGTKFRSNRFVAHFLGEYPDLFDGDPRVSGSSKEASLWSRDGRLLFWADSGGIGLANLWDGQVEIDVRSHVQMSLKLLGEYLDMMTPTPRGLVFEIERIRPEEYPARVISRHFCQDRWTRGPLDRPSTFEIRTARDFMLAGRFPVLGAMNCSSEIPENSDTGTETQFASFLTEGIEATAGGQPVIFVGQKIATTADAIDREEVEAILSLLPIEFDDMLKLYFPDSGENLP